MRQFCRQAKFAIGIILWFFIIVAMFIVGWSMSFTSIDLNNVPRLLGIVSTTNIQQNTGTKAPVGQMALVIYIDNEQNGLWLYRASQNYEDITSQVTKGTTITVSHSERLGSNNYYTIYEIQKNKRVVYSKDEYTRKEKLAGRLVVFPGALILLIILIYQSNKKLLKRRSFNLDTSQ